MTRTIQRLLGYGDSPTILLSLSPWFCVSGLEARSVWGRGTKRQHNQNIGTNVNVRSENPTCGLPTSQAGTANMALPAVRESR